MAGHEAVDSVQVVRAKMLQLHDDLFTGNLGIVD